MDTMMMNRGAMPMPGIGMSGMTMPAMPSANAMPAMNMMMVPNCMMRMEKCEGGMKMMCKCEDAAAAATLQSLCKMMAGSMCSCAIMMNGMMVCCCNMMMGMTKFEMTDDGVTMTCMSGDADCCKMIQACCDCMTSMMEAGCSCCMMMNNMPICCGIASM